MARPPVSIIILAWNAWGETQACLESLRPTMGVRDQVVVVDNGSVDATPSRLRLYPWVEVVTNAENRGFAAGCNQGARLARHELVVFLNNDTVLTGRWIDALIEPFVDSQVGASGPRSNFVSGPQVADGASYLPGDMTGMRSFARQWSEDHRSRTTVTNRLVGFCLAVRRQAFEQVGGFDEGYKIGGFEDDDLCHRLADANWKLVIAHGSFVHHSGHKSFDVNQVDWFAQQETNRALFEAKFGDRSSRDFPLVSACLIIKDEEESLPGCLASLEGFADEIVIYDTGSTDQSVEVARALGATVYQGYWDDDFSRARNASLEHCQGEWIAWLDADESLVCDDIPALRRRLMGTPTRFDGYSVVIENLTGAGVGSMFVHSACRLFRRSACQWSGRIHEQVTVRQDQRMVALVALDEARILHTGYLAKTMVDRDKAGRNLRLAQTEVGTASGLDEGFSLTSLGRSHMTAGHFEEAFEHCRQGYEATTNPVTKRLAIRTAAEALAMMGRFDEGLEWIAKLRQASTNQVLADLLEANLRRQQGEYELSLSMYDRLSTRQFDDDGFEYDIAMFSHFRAEVQAALGRFDEAAESLLDVLGTKGILDTHLGTLVAYLDQAKRPLSELAQAIPPQRVQMFLAQILQLHPELADRVLEACWDGLGDEFTVLATAASLAQRLPVDRALVWSSRIRQLGITDGCPLVGIATDHTLSPIERSRAAAAGYRMFEDRRLYLAFKEIWASANAFDRSLILNEASALCPMLVAGYHTPQPFTSTPVSSIPDFSDALPLDTLPSTISPLHARPIPLVSIVIPCFNEATYTLSCLQSLGAHTSAGTYEVIIVDNGSTDVTRDLASLQDAYFSVLRNDINLGFGKACNQGAAKARGRYILFLNNDTLLLPGWLEPLMAALDEDPHLGAVQPKLLYPDGRLNDAGGLIFSGGEAWIYGKGHRIPDAPEFACRRAPDYVSGACLLVRADAFAAVGGFDDRYSPAYYEDVDLSFSLRAAGWKVLYEPASCVVHVEGGTAGTDPSKGLKRFQQINMSLFADKWAHELSRRPSLDPAIVEQWAHRSLGGFGPGEELESEWGPGAWDRACQRTDTGRCVAVFDAWMPMFDRASGSLRLYTLLRCLRQEGHQVVLYATQGGSRRYADAIGRFGIVCYGLDPSSVPSEKSTQSAHIASFGPQIDYVLSQRPYDTVILTPWMVAEAMIDSVRAVKPHATVIIDTNDIEFVRRGREVELGGNKALNLEAQQTKQRELATYRRADWLICVTDNDAEAVRHEIDDARIAVIPNAHGRVDSGPSFDERSDLCFVGNFNHPPNADAIGWWKAEIAPRLEKRLPGICLRVVGNDPLGQAKAMAGEGVSVVGTVPDTLPYLHSARVSVAPLRFGAGMKGKVGEAMAAGLPVVATSVAAEGMGLVDGEQVIIADDPDEFAAAIERLYTDGDLWHRLRANAQAHVEDQFGVDRMGERLRHALQCFETAIT